MISAVSRMARRLQLDERGTGLLEMAVLAPMLALLTVGIIDLSQGMSRRMDLHSAVHRTLEKTAARRFKLVVSSGQVDTSFMKADAAAAAGVPVEEVTVTAWLECDGVKQPSFTSDCPAPADPEALCSSPAPPPEAKCEAILARYVAVRIDTHYFPTLGRVVVADIDGKVPLFAEAAVRVQ